MSTKYLYEIRPTRPVLIPGKPCKVNRPISLNLSREECAKICNCNPEKIKIVCQQNKFSKTKEQRAELRKKTLQQKYGVTNISQLKEIKDKKKQTTLKNYGVENPAQSSEIKNKMKETCLKKYGVESTNSLPSKKEKIKRTKQEKQKQRGMEKH